MRNAAAIFSQTTSAFAQDRIYNVNLTPQQKEEIKKSALSVAYKCGAEAELSPEVNQILSVNPTNDQDKIRVSFRWVESYFGEMYATFIYDLKKRRIYAITCSNH